MTNKPKSITLQEFEELAKEFVNKMGTDELSYYLPEHVPNEFLYEFKSFIFKEELEKERRRKDYEKLKEEYFKLKAEFEPDSGEVEYVKQPETCLCAGCCFLTESNACSRPRYLGNSCEYDRHIWIKA